MRAARGWRPLAAPDGAASEAEEASGEKRSVSEDMEEREVRN
jgi:hypothetical protein